VWIKCKSLTSVDRKETWASTSAAVAVEVAEALVAAEEVSWKLLQAAGAVEEAF